MKTSRNWEESSLNQWLKTKIILLLLYRVEKYQYFYASTFDLNNMKYPSKEGLLYFFEAKMF